MGAIGVKLNKALLRIVGGIFPSKRHPLGKIGNSLRCYFARRVSPQVGLNCVIEKGAEIQEGVVLYNGSCVGENALISTGTVIKGKNMMGPNVHIYTSNHYYDSVMHRFNGHSDIRPVVIGEHTWIGYDAIILPGVEIGRNTIIGAGAVVTKSIPSGVLAAGNPCVVKKIIDKAIYDEDMCEG